ncbi:MAG: hypothetical protein DRR42_01820 [Gammaproteobacteria bacterium]|nr:MAG: hypothetical protein DRR42_01820 [Gammaproteobacteria bacterium]
MAMLLEPAYQCEKCESRVAKLDFASRTPPNGWQFVHSWVHGESKPPDHELDAFRRNLELMPEPFALPRRRAAGNIDAPVRVFVCDECLDQFSNFQALEREIRESSGCPYTTEEIRQLVPYVLRVREHDVDDAPQTPPKSTDRANSGALFHAVKQLHSEASRPLREAHLADVLQLCESGENVLAAGETGRTVLQSLVEINDYDLHRALGIYYGDDRDVTRIPYPMQSVFHYTLDIEKAARTLIAFGGDIDAPVPGLESTLLIHLAKYRSSQPDHLETVNPFSCTIALLLKLGADPRLCIADGQSTDNSTQEIFQYWQEWKAKDQP